MTKLPFFLILSFLITPLCYADGTSVTYTQPPLNIQEEDGSPSTFPYILKFPNGGVTDNGDGSTSVLGADFTLSGPVTINSDLTISGSTSALWTDTIKTASGGTLGIDPDNDDTNEFTIDTSGNFTSGTASIGGDGERVTGTTYGNYVDFNDYGADQIVISGDVSMSDDLTVSGTASITQDLTAGGSSFVVEERIDGSETMRVADDGNVGIGTSAPAYKLNVYGGNIISSESSGSGGSVYLEGNTSGPNAQFGTNADTDSYMKLGAYGGINNIETKGRDLKIFSTSDSSGIYYENATGDVGIGTTAPTRKLDVSGDAGISSDLTIGGNVFFDTTGGGMQIGCLSGHNVNFDTVLAAQDTWYQILAFNEAGAGRGKIISEVDEDHIKVLISGIYQIAFSIQGHSGTSNDYIVGVRKNNGTEAADSIDVHLTTAVVDRIVGGSNLCYAFLDANDTIEIWIQRTDGAAVSKTFTTDHVTLNVKLIGY